MNQMSRLPPPNEPGAPPRHPKRPVMTDKTDKPDADWKRELPPEAYRVLRPGSRFLCLEFSTVDVPGLDTLYDFFSFKVIPPLGRAVTGDAESYQYLVESIRKFPRPNAFADMIRAAGFSRVQWQSLTGGIVALHSGWRL